MRYTCRLATAAALSLAGAAADAAILQFGIGAANWDSVTSWSVDGDAQLHSFVYDNGEIPVLQGPAQWVGAAPGVQSGTYSGIISIDLDSNEIVGGSLVVSGSIAEMFVVGTTWWLFEFENLTIDFSTGTVSADAVNCYMTTDAPLPCVTAAQFYGLPQGLFGPLGGPAGVAGAFHPGALLSDGRIEIFHDGFDAMNLTGRDTLVTLQLLTVPLPAAAWLFTGAVAALGCLVRRYRFT